MERSDEMDELKHLAPTLHGLKRTDPFTVPDGFFERFPHQVQAAIVERQERSAIVHKDGEVVANHWLNTEWNGRPRGIDSRGRQRGLKRQVEQLGNDLGQGFAWLRPPVLNRLTRLAASLNPATGTLQVVGLERQGSIALPATRTLTLTAPPPKRR